MNTPGSGGLVLAGTNGTIALTTPGVISIGGTSVTNGDIANSGKQVINEANRILAKAEDGAEGSSNSNIPVKDKTTASNGLNYQSNPKHTPGQPGNRPNAGIEPKNSLDLFGESIPSTKYPNQRFSFDKGTNTLHRFFEDGNGTWHWSGSTNQGANSLMGKDVPNDIKNIFGLPKKGW